MRTTYDQLFIGGAWVDPATSNRIDVVSPHTEEVVGHAPEASTDDVDRAVCISGGASADR